MTVDVLHDQTLGRTYEVMGTVVSFIVPAGGLSDAAVHSAITRACQTLRGADETFSTWKPQSPMSRLRRGETPIAELPTEVATVLSLCECVKAASGGWFDPWAMPGGVDPTGLVKGWAAEQALAELVQAGIPAAMVNAGGDLAVHGRPSPAEPWRVGIRHPWRVDALACIIEADAAVATSGAYERGEHLIDPHSGKPITRAVSATVTGPRLAIADALATALVVAGADEIGFVTALPGYDAYVIRRDGTELASDGIRFAPSA
jgi:FAD:protein FMN transferase